VGDFESDLSRAIHKCPVDCLSPARGDFKLEPAHQERGIYSASIPDCKEVSNVRTGLVVYGVQRNEFRAPNNPPPGMPITRWSEQDSAAVPVGLCWPTR